MIAMRAVDVVQPDICYLGGMTRTLRVAGLAHAAGLPCTPHSANLSLVTLFTMHLLGAIPNAGKYLELSIEGPDYYPWQEGLYVRSPYAVVDGKVTIPSEPGWGVEIAPAWLAQSQHQQSEIAVSAARSARRAGAGERHAARPARPALHRRPLRARGTRPDRWRPSIRGAAPPSPSSRPAMPTMSMPRSAPRGRRCRAAGAARTPAERGRILHRAAALIRAQADRLAVVEALDSGKTLSEARGDVAGAARTFEYYAGACDKLQGDTIPLDAGHLAYTILEPVGVTRADRAVELPDLDHGARPRAGARRRLHGRGEAGRDRRR